MSGEEVLTVRSLSKSFGEKRVFGDVSFDLMRGERMFLVGANGCGKTTLLKILMKDIEQSGGDFRFGANLFPGYFDQVQEKLDLSKSALEEVWSAFPAMTETSVRNALAAFLFRGDDVYKLLSDCSGGERARVALLKLMLGRYNLLLLDEPTNHLDSSSREELESTLLDYSGTLLIVSHDRYFINKLATCVLELTESGVKRYIGNYDDFIEAKQRAQQDAPLPLSVKKREAAQPNEYKLKKELASRQRKLKTAVSRLESDIEDTEEQIAMLEEELNSNPPYEQFLVISRSLEELTAKRDALFEEWAEKSEELTSINL